MTTVLDKCCREHKNTHFIFNNLVSKILQFTKKCRKAWWKERGHKLRHNMTHTRSKLDKQGYMHARACTRPRALAHLTTLAHTHTNT
jgi:hypothetical protein